MDVQRLSPVSYRHLAAKTLAPAKASIISSASTPSQAVRFEGIFNKKPKEITFEQYKEAKDQFKGNLSKGALFLGLGIATKFLTLPIPCCWIVILPLLTLNGIMKLRKGMKQRKLVNENAARFEPNQPNPAQQAQAETTTQKTNKKA